MIWRRLCLARAWSAAGLLSWSLLAAAAPMAAAAGEPEAPLPALAAPVETVSVLDARKTGDLAVELRGAGQDRVRMALKNTSGKRLRVVIPPGLVASSAAAQGRGGGFQSMGLGAANNRPGTFGAFRGLAAAPAGDDRGFRSVGLAANDPTAVPIEAGQTAELSVTSVCLNYGVTTPTPRDRFELVDVAEYTSDERVRKALRSLATYGTSQGVAQAAMWRVCNDVPFATLAREPKKTFNARELALAARFVEALDASSSTDLVDPAYLNEGRLFVAVRGENGLAAEAARLAGQMEGLSLLGLPVRVLRDSEAPRASAPALWLEIVLTGSKVGETRGQVVVREAASAGRWSALGKTPFTDPSTASVLDAATLARTVGRSVATTFVATKGAARAGEIATLRVENRLPFTLANVALRGGQSSGAAVVPFQGLGIAPGRAAAVTVPGPGVVIDRVELNGL